MAWNAKINRTTAAIDQRSSPDDDPASSPDHLHHFARRSTRRDDVLDDKNVFARLKLKTAPQLHSALAPFGEERPNPERPRNLVRNNHSTKRRRDDQIDPRNPIVTKHTGHECRTELLGHRRMLQHQRTLQIS
jgi:hypothetical protein